MTPLGAQTHTSTGHHRVPSARKHAPPSAGGTAVPSPASAAPRCRGCGGGRDPAVRKQRAGASVFSVRRARGIPVLPPVPPRQGKQPRPGPVCLPWPRPQRECSCSAAGRCGTFAPEPGCPPWRHPDATPEHRTDPRPPPGGGWHGGRQGAVSTVTARAPTDATAALGHHPAANGKFPSPPPRGHGSPAAPGPPRVPAEGSPAAVPQFPPGALPASRSHTERRGRHGHAVLCPKNTRTAPPRGSP